MGKKILKHVLILTCSVFICSQSICNEKNVFTWTISNDSSILVFHNEEHIKKWAQGPWTCIETDLLESTDNMKLFVLTRTWGSGITRSSLSVFVHNNECYSLYANTNNEIITSHQLSFNLKDSLLTIRDGNIIVGTLFVNPNLLPDFSESSVMDNLILDNRANVTIDNKPLRNKSYFSEFNYNCVIKGIIINRLDVLYFDGGYNAAGGSISAIQVKVISYFGQKTGDTIWIFPDTINLQNLPGIINYGYIVPSGPYYFGVKKRGCMYEYMLDDPNFMLLPDNERFLFYYNLIGKKKKNRIKTFEHKLQRKYKKKHTV